jgi:hypothetical protein
VEACDTFSFLRR